MQCELTRNMERDQRAGEGLCDSLTPWIATQRALPHPPRLGVERGWRGSSSGAAVGEQQRRSSGEGCSSSSSH